MKQDRGLEQLDRKIMRHLQEDATCSHAEIGERVGASPASVWRRIKALEAAGFLGRTVRLVEPSKIGRQVNVLCSVRMSDHVQATRQAFETFVRGRPEIVECFSMTGDFDYLLRVVVADVSDYNDFLMLHMLDHPAVAGASSQFALETTKYTTALPV